MDEDAHHGEVAMRFAGGVLGVDVVLVDVLGPVSAGAGYCVGGNVRTLPSTRPTASVSRSGEVSCEEEPSPLSVPWV